MPKLVKSVAQGWVAEKDLHVEEMATVVDIPVRTLQNALYGVDTMRPGRVHRVVTYFADQLDRPFDEVYDALVLAGGKPDQPPDQPTQPTGPDPRRDGRRGDTPTRSRPTRDNRSPRKSDRRVAS